MPRAAPISAARLSRRAVSSICSTVVQRSGADERLDDGGHAEHLGRVEHDVGGGDGHGGAAAVGVHEGLGREEGVPGRSGEPVRAEGGGERLGASHEVIRLDRGEAAGREFGEGCIEVCLECLADGEQLDGRLNRHGRVLLQVFGDRCARGAKPHGSMEYLRVEVFITTLVVCPPFPLRPPRRPCPTTREIRRACAARTPRAWRAGRRFSIGRSRSSRRGGRIGRACAR